MQDAAKDFIAACLVNHLVTIYIYASIYSHSYWTWTNGNGILILYVGGGVRRTSFNQVKLKIRISATSKAMDDQLRTVIALTVDWTDEFAHKQKL